jgi:capsular polysaccharide biosynthesis protein
VSRKEPKASVDRRLLAWAVAASLLACVVVTWATAQQTSKYEASIKILVGQKEPPATSEAGIHPLPNARVPGLRQRYTLTIAKMVPTKPVAQAVVKRLSLPKGSAGKVLENMSVESDPGTMYIDVTYTDSDPKRAQLVANAIGQVVSQRVGEAHLGNNTITAMLWQPAQLPQNPVSPKPLRNGFIALVATLAISGAIVAGREYLRGRTL